MKKDLMMVAMGALMLAPCASFAADKAMNPDQMFVNMATEGGQFEVKSSKIAGDKSKNPDVMAFAKHMISDHEGANDKLMQVVKGSDLSQPKDFDKMHDQQLDELRNAAPADFDKLYLTMQDKSHKMAIATFQKEADQGKVDSLKMFASQTLPVLQSHQQELMSLEQKMGMGMDDDKGMTNPQ